MLRELQLVYFFNAPFLVLINHLIVKAYFPESKCIKNTLQVCIITMRYSFVLEKISRFFF